MTALQLGGLVPMAGVGLLVVAVVVVVGSLEVVDAYEKRALVVSGEYRRMLEPGVNFVPPFVSETTSIDRRSQRATVTAEATTADGVPARVEAAVDVSVTDAERAFLETDDYRRDTIECVDSSLRDALAEVDRETLVAARSDVADRVRRAVVRRSAGWGIEVEAVELTDVTVLDGTGTD